MDNSRETKHFEDDDADIKRYFGLFLSNWYWFVASLFMAGILAYGINTYSEKIFIVNASLLIGNESQDVSGLERMMPGGDIFKSKENLHNEIGILKSFDVNRKVMEELPEFHVTIIGVGKRGIAQVRHYKTAPFKIEFDSLSHQSLGVPLNIKVKSSETYIIEIDGITLKKNEYSFGERFNEAGFDFTINRRVSKEFRFDPSLSNKFTIWFNGPGNLANTYRGKLVINPLSEEATLVNLSISGTSPAQEADYLNKLMDVYIRQGLEYKNQTAEKTIEFIDRQLGLISDSLSTAEDKLEKFRYANKLIDLSSEGTAIKTKLESYTQEKISAGLQMKYFEYLAEYLKSKDESGDIISPSVMGVSDPLLIKLVDQLSNLQTRKKQLNYNLNGNQSALKLIYLEIEDAKTSLKENVQNNIISINRALNDIESRIKNVEYDLNRLPGTERKLINIQRKFDLNNTVYTYMLEKRSEAGIAKASNVSGNRVIDRAVESNCYMVSPQSRKNYILAIILGLLIPGIYIFIVDQFHNKILDKKDIEKGTVVPIIGFIGHNSIKSEIPVNESPGSALSESFRTIRTNLKYYLNDLDKPIIAVTSTLSGEGKTFIALNLATAISMLGKKVLLIGMDLRRPRMDKVLNHVSAEGLSTYLIGESSLEQIIKKTEIENLSFVPSGSIPPNPSELLQSGRMDEFIDSIKIKFDYIVIDTPPVGVVSDALLLSKYSDLNIFVIRQKFSFKSTLELIQSIYNRNELKNLTIAVNDIHISGYYGYGLRYGYGFYQGYGYAYGYQQYHQYGKSGYSSYYKD